MTLVGDIAQATGPWARETWEEIIEELPQRREPERRELTTGYRIPAPAMELAIRVLREAAPTIPPPVALRKEGDDPVVAHVESLHDSLGDFVRDEIARVDEGNVAVIAPRSLIDTCAEALTAAGIEFGGATRSGLDRRVTLVPVQLVKGLEVDAAIVIEPTRIVSEERQGLRALYVALTRATKRVGVVHAEPLPTALASHPKSDSPI